MVNAIDLSKYVICKLNKKKIKVNHLKLQKLLYYIQVWHIVYADEKIINDDFEAWLHGPVVRSVWDHYKGFSIMLEDLPCESVPDTLHLYDDQEDIIDDVLDEYGDKSGYHLECLTHSEEPWKKARAKGENTIISQQDIKEYYSKLIDEK